jgi:hypothetical protein
MPHDRDIVRAEPVLSQLTPFNAHRFDVCMTYLAREHGKTLTQYDLVKLHVMSDVFHVLTYGAPIIGGALERWDHGPVIRRAYDRLMSWWHRFRETGEQSDCFAAEPYMNKQVMFSPCQRTDFDDLSESEIESLERAWDTVMSMDWTASQEFFHNPKYYMGRAWTNAKAEGRPIDWREIVDAYDLETGEDHSHIKRLIRF